MAASRRGWQYALARFVDNPKHEDVVRDLETCVIVRDAFPKSRYHYLAIVKDHSLRSLADLRTEHAVMLSKMLGEVGAFVEELRSDVAEADPPVVWRFGFHAIPSMVNLHLHVISHDLVSDRLKHKKQYNSFATDFFISPQTVLDKLRADGNVTFDRKYYEAALRTPLACYHCDQKFATIPRLKEHLATCPVYTLAPPQT